MRSQPSIAQVASWAIMLVLLSVSCSLSQPLSIEWIPFDTIPARVCDVFLTSGDSLYLGDLEGEYWLTDDRGNSWRKIERGTIPGIYGSTSWSDNRADTSSDFAGAVISKVREDLPFEAEIEVRSKWSIESALITVVIYECEGVDRTKDSLVLPTVSHHTTLIRYALWKARRVNAGKIVAVRVDEDTVVPMNICYTGRNCYDWEPGKFRVIPIGAERFLVYEFWSELAEPDSNGIYTYDAFPVIDLKRDTTIIVPAPGSKPRGRVVVWSSATAVYGLADEWLWWFPIPASDEEEPRSRRHDPTRRGDAGYN